MSNTKPAVTVTHKPSGEYLDRETGELRPLERSTLKLMLKGWDIKKKIDALEAELKGINAHFIDGYGAPTSLIMPGVCRVAVAERESVKIVDEAKLQALLGERFKDLVKASTKYAPTEQLQEIASSADDPLAKPLRKLLSVAKSETVTWRAEK
ncbi:hypothetical protein [Rhodoferax sp.]|uniref:hypothetical protein n=1 Tax=Rhodoferax sp. TaxID=50421 RepID=UPI00260806B5|nr:hypothetical protein [Rhodoferax sp.]MDD3938021.1 hypothetical protein [Rhodoferax sp.]